MNTIILEIRPGEGGDDAKLLVAEQTKIYLKLAERQGWHTDIIEYQEGSIG